MNYETYQNVYHENTTFEELPGIIRVLQRQYIIVILERHADNIIVN
jgi:hypothetical protein